MVRKEDLKFSFQEDDFIQSKDGRLLRVIAEYQYPNLQFEKLGVKNLIVFFGSARALNQEQTQSLIKSSPDDPLLKMSKYYDSTEKLAAKLVLGLLKTPLEMSMQFVLGVAQEL